MMTFSDQSIGRDRVVVDFPGVGQRAVQFEKVPQAGRIAPPDDFFRDVVTTASHSLSNAGDAGLRARQPYVDEMEPKTGLDHGSNLRREASAGKRSLESEVPAFALTREFAGA